MIYQSIEETSIIPRILNALTRGIFILLILLFVVKIFIPRVIDSLENQRVATNNYNCKHYGDQINKHYGSEKCEIKSAYQ